MEDIEMKKVFLLLLTVVICFAGTAKLPADSWIISEKGKMNCKQVQVGSLNARILLQDGKKIVVPLAQINSYSLNGKVYNKLTLNNNGKSSNRKVFMELVKTRKGYSLYKYYRCDIESPHDCYYIYKGEQFCYALDESMEPKRLKNLFRYYGILAVLQ
jgi:hypothetical protein